ncbi:hypothetical protein ABFS82_10G065200 [Erythranthe guttata]|uniref:uncharacterized protein LOC105949957 isoform X2 n=1 Tax=Erythranthe guttata TaxID=4155 RepID=UPI00064D873C|nr:PREDICTED: uncharacterized protein LOC105949957 isoform X2 [Erythranthe guttata]|eukprot:XP_012828717.1 PREDICTED: uncharacterized protein LOC105949957 isoform X2 [Erythranthe guttata]
MSQLGNANMVEKGNISDYRNKLDKTLTSPDLTSDENVRTLVKNQILQSLASESEEYNEYVVERRSREMSNFLNMLRSASANEVEMSKSINESHNGWKIKQDTDEFRVMYREGPEGTPLHTLLVEGYVDGPVDVCACVSSESDLYKKWWPQSAIPTFKVTSSECLQKVRIGEQISLVRMKVSWPLSSREALVHYFVFEYFRDGLVVVLLNSISDSETVNKSTHGFTRDFIPDAEDVVRIGVVGGFAIQKVTQDRSYFRTIANMDLKLDLIPPALLNFISRQLVGSGFKLYKKEVALVSQGDKKFVEALKGPLYTRIHNALYSQNTSVMLEEPPIEASKDNNATININDAAASDEIEELDKKDTEEKRESLLDKCIKITCHNLGQEITEEFTEVEKAATNGITENKVSVRPEVQQALGTLDKAITILREYNNNNNNNISPDDKSQLCNVEKRDSISSGENIQTRSKIAPAPQDENLLENQNTVSKGSEKTVESISASADAKGIIGNRGSKMKNRKSKFLFFKVTSV